MIIIKPYLFRRDLIRKAFAELVHVPCSTNISAMCTFVWENLQLPLKLSEFKLIAYLHPMLLIFGFSLNWRKIGENYAIDVEFIISMNLFLKVDCFLKKIIMWFNGWILLLKKIKRYINIWKNIYNYINILILQYSLEKKLWKNAYTYVYAQN